MPEETVDHKAEDAALLVAEPETPAKEPEETEPAAEAAEAPAAEPEEKPLPEWSKPLTKLQQELSTQKKINADLNSKLDKLLAFNGIETEAPAVEQQAQAEALPSETQMEIAQLRQEVQFTKLRQAVPGFEPEKAWDQSWDDALETMGVAKDATELPEGITRKALQKLADKNFDAQVAKAKAKKPATPSSPPRRPADPTQRGPGVPRPASHVPSPASRLSPRDQNRKDCADLMGNSE